MNWKLVLLTSTAVVSVSLFATGAQAEGPPSNYEPPPEVEFRPPPPPPPVLRPSQAKPCCEPSGWYVSVLGGGNWTDDQLAYHFAANPSGGGSAPDAFYAYQEYKAETGFVVGAAVGKDLCCWLPGLRGEVELTYRRNEVNGYHEDGTDTLASSNQQPDVTGPIEGTISSWALMANLWYDFKVDKHVVPYIGGG
ncbi:MAG TPA: hypothetical protein DCL48_03445, partial [Alphaproteobacteria bacterium]|nr:hypothetical protein [Alphaproteobacteria bacterium]